MKAVLSSVKQFIMGGPSKDILRGMLTLALGAGSARLIGLISLPVLTRIYTPSDFGLFSIFTAIVLLLTPVVTLRYATAIPLPKNNKNSLSVLYLCFMLIGLFCSLLFVVLFFFSSNVFNALSLGSLEPYWFLLVVSILCSSVYETLTLLSTRVKKYKTIAYSQIIQSLICEIFKIGLFYLVIGPVGLLVGYIAGHASGSLYYFRVFSRDIFGNIRACKKVNIYAVMRAYKDFPRFRLIAQLLLVFSMQSPVILVAIIYNEHTAGQFSLAFLAVALPFNLIGQSVSNAYYGEIAKLGISNVESILKLTKSIAIRLFCIALPFSIILFLFGSEIFSLILGRKWEMAGSIASILSVFLIFQFISAPLLQVLNVIKKQKFALVFHGQRALLVIIVFYVSYKYSLGAINLVYVYTLAMCIHYSFMSYKILSLLKREVAKKTS